MRKRGITNRALFAVKPQFLVNLLRKKVVRVALISLLILSPFFANYQLAYAAPNYQINYQGKLTDSTGTALGNGTYSLVFKIYDTASGGVALWTETHATSSTKITLTNGLFSVMLGSITPLSSLDFNQTLYLGVTVESDSEMTPRKVIGAVPAAFQADKIDGLDSTDFLSTSTASNSKLWSLTGLGQIGSSTATSTVLGKLATVGETIIGGILSAYDRITAPYFTATSTSQASTFPYASTTAITATTASTTNLIVSGLGSGLTKLTDGVMSLAVAGTDYISSSFRDWNIVGGQLTPTTTIPVKIDYASTTALTVSGNAYFPGSGIWNSSGYVGIGTTTPKNNLHINGSTWVYTRITNDTTGSMDTDGLLLGIQDTGDADIWQKENNYIRFGTSDLERMRITSAGNVGIGTSTPLGKLDVYGGGSNLDTKFVAGSSGSQSSTLFLGTTYNRGWNIISNAYNSVKNKYDLTITPSNFAGDLILNNGTYAGNVGIGTTSPATPLDVWGASGNILSLTATGGAANSNAKISFQNGRGTVGWDSASNLIFETSDYAKKMQFQVNGTPYLTINNGTSGGVGYVGIGTTTPLDKLSIYDGNIRFTKTLASTGEFSRISAYNFGGGGEAASIQFLRDSTGDWDYGALAFSTRATERMRITSGGYVGIGTTTPNNKLDVYDTSKAAIGFSGESGSTYKWTIGMDVTNGGKFSIASSTALGTSNRLVIDGGGNVGIGTDAPLAKLNVKGWAEVGNTDPYGYTDRIFSVRNSWSNLTSGTYYGILDSNANYPSTNTSVNLYGITSNIKNRWYSSFTQSGDTYGIYGTPMVHLDSVTNDQTVTVSGKLIGVAGKPTVLSSTGDTVNLSDVRSLYASEPTITGTGSMTNVYGLYVDDIDVGTNNYAIYTAGTVKSSFGGNVGIGTTSPYALLSVGGASAGTSALTVNSSGDVAIGQGGFSGQFNSTRNSTYSSSYTQHSFTGSYMSPTANGADYINTKINSILAGSTYTGNSTNDYTNLYLQHQGGVTASTAKTLGNFTNLEMLTQGYQGSNMTFTSMYGIHNTLQNGYSASNGNTVTSAYGALFDWGGNYGPISTAYGLRINPAITNGTGGSVTTNYGLYIDSPSGASTNYAIYSNGANFIQYASTTALTVSGAGSSFIVSSGNVGIGTTSPGTSLSIGSTNGINFNPTGTSTLGNDTSGYGINLRGGCFAIKGVCVGGGGTGSGTVNSGAIYSLTYYPSAGTTVDDAGDLLWDNTNKTLSISTTTTGFGNSNTGKLFAKMINSGFLTSSLLGAHLATSTYISIGYKPDGFLYKDGGAGANTYISSGYDGYSGFGTDGSGGNAGNVYLAAGGDGGSSAEGAVFGDDGTVYIGNANTGSKRNAFLHIYGTSTTLGKAYVGTTTATYSTEDQSDPTMTLYSNGNSLLDVQANSSNVASIRFVKGGDSQWYISSRGSGDTSNPNGFVIYKTHGYGTFDSSSNRLAISSNGNMGVASATPWRTFGVNGTFGLSSSLTVEAGSDNYLCIDPTTYEVTNGGANCGASASRYKKDITALNYGLDDLMRLRPVSFYWNDLAGRPDDTSRKVGFIAEEVLSVIPEVVTYSRGEIQGLEYDKLAAVIIKSIQEQQAEIETLKNNIALLQGLSSNFSLSSEGVLTVKTVKAEQLCLGETCVDEPTLKNLLQNAGLLAAPVVPVTSSEPEPEATSTPETTPEPEASSETTTPVDPEPEPVVESSPEPAAEPTPKPIPEPVSSPPVETPTE